MTCCRTSFALLLVLCAPTVFAQQPTQDIAPEDFATVDMITEMAVSPDGKLVVYCLATWDQAEDNRKSDLWVVAADGTGKPSRLTFDRANDRKPKWSADGKTLYFLGNRKRAAEVKPPFDGTTQVWRIDATGGEPKPVTREPAGVSGYDYAPQANAIFFSKDSEQTDEDGFSKLRAKFSKVEYGHGKRKVSEIYRLDVSTWRSEKLPGLKRYIREFAVTRDGKRIGLVSAFDDSVVKSEGESRVDVWEAGEPGASATGGTFVTPPTDVYRDKAVSPWAWLEDLTWSPDGTKFAFCAIFDGYPTEVVLGEWKDGRWTTVLMPRGENGKVQIRGYGTPLWWHGPNELLGLSEREGSVGYFRYDVLAKQAVSVIQEGVVTYALAAAGTAHAVRVCGTPGGFADLELINVGPPRNKLTDLNPHARTWKLPTVRHILWKARDGTPVGGVLELPHGYRKGERLPLVVAIHGGPTTASYGDLRFDPHNGRLYFAAKGYAVLLPNYRGSTGYGDRFVTDLIGNENDREVQDILAGIQHLVREGIADPDRVGVMGWSNGGYLTNCLITLKDAPVKFRAASSGAGILDTVAEWGFNDEPAYAMVFKKGLPWDQPDLYRRTSPTYGLGHVTTPTLIHVGGNDVRCPPGHSRMLYRALKEYNKVPTELVVYTGEPHGLSKLSNRIAKMTWDLAWFERYLKAPAR